MKHAGESRNLIFAIVGMMDVWYGKRNCSEAQTIEKDLQEKIKLECFGVVSKEETREGRALGATDPQLYRLLGRATGSDIRDGWLAM